MMSDDIIYRCGQIEVNDTRHVVTAAGVPVVLTACQYHILLFLITRPGRVVSEDTLLHDVLGYNEDSYSRTACTHIKRLRRSLGEFGRMIVTIRSFGYKLEAV
jgi:DNA-binding response OmpR family regulator